MRNLILSFAMLVLPFLVFANDIGRQDLTGNWYSKCISETIKIKEKRDVLIVKGLGDCNGIEVFERINKRSYADRVGNLLIVDKCDVLVFIPNKGRRHKEIIFEKTRNDRNAWFNNDDDQYDRESNHGNRNHDRYGNGSNGQQGQPSDNRWNNYERGVTGTWDAGFKEKTIAMIDTRDGLKAKFSGTSKWVDYVQSRQNPYEFVDAKGNKYIFNGQGSASWIPNDRSIKEIYLTKISDDTQF